jgi:preprotein translocase subunit YajC
VALLESRVDRGGDHDRRAAQMQALVDELRTGSGLVAAGGVKASVERHHGRG